MDLTRWLPALLWLGCASLPPPSSAGQWSLPDAEGRPHRLVDGQTKLTVIEFFSAHCPCQKQHDQRLRSIADAYRDRSVSVVAVDSEVGAGSARAGEEKARRGYPFPILIDADGSVATALHASYATYTVIADREGRILYAGGIDSDKNHLTADATPFLREALDDALADRPVRRPVGKTLGCALVLK